MKIQRTITFTGKNLNDVFGLPCVKCIMKVDSIDRRNGLEGSVLLICYRVMMRGERTVVKEGDHLIQYTDGTWYVES